MQAIADRGQTAMQWLLILGLAAAWAAFDRSPRVVEEARTLVDAMLRNPTGIGLKDDPLAGLSADAQMLFRQYRHEHLQIAHSFDQGQRAARWQSLRPVTIGSTIAMGKHVLAQIDAQPVPGLRETIVIAPLRQSVARLETWQAQSGLGPTATLAQVEAELRSRVPIPGTEQDVPVEQCMLFVGVGLFGLQIFLCSLLATLRESPGIGEVDRGWVLLHRGQLGWLLTVAWLTLPAAFWIGQAFVRAMNQVQLPPAGTWLLASALLVATLFTVRHALAVRRMLLFHSDAPSPGKIVPKRVMAA